MSEGPAIIVTMPLPPSTNKLWSRGAGGRRVRSPEYRSWLETAGWEVRRQVVGMAPLDCRFNLTIEVPVSRRDTGNWEKPICDLCQHAGVISNDGNAHQITITPVARADCMAAFFPLPEMEGVRKAAKLRLRTAASAQGRRSRPRAKPGLTWRG